jgi:hypothetical protein
MGRPAITQTDEGAVINPVTPDAWLDWVSATRTRNHVLGEPLLDWLERYGAERGYLRDDELPGYDPRTDFTVLIFDLGRRFEAAVADHLRTLTEVEAIAAGAEDVRSLDAAEHTFDAMTRGVPIIHQGVLRNPQNRTYGAPDFLFRSDVLSRLFPDCISDEEAAVTAPDLPGPWHYRIVDAKFTTLRFTAGGLLGNGGSSSAAYKVQLHTYNQALGRLQGMQPDAAYLLGRGWEQSRDRGSSCMERLAPITAASTLTNGRVIETAAIQAREWIRDLRRHGSEWQLLPQPSRPELYPNFSNTQDGPWHTFKRQLAEELEDLTLLWQVAVLGRESGHKAGVYRWTDPRCTPEVVAVTGAKKAHVLAALLEVNRTTEGPNVRPTRIRASESHWREEPPLEFYVDFETVSDLNDDFSSFPTRGGQPLIFMIGCGHIEDGEWHFTCYQAGDLTPNSEAAIIDAWLDHMSIVRGRLSPGSEPPVIHWSPAEESTYEKQYNSAKNRHPDKDWPTPHWFDFLNRVMKDEPVVIRGAMNFGLKAVAKALHKHGLIETLWGDGPTDGLGAMVGAWRCYEESTKTGQPVQSIGLMQQIAAYNEVDCRVMMEAIRYLRLNH